MARNEDVSTAIWEDEDFDALSDDAAFIYVWSFTNERCNMAGIYQVKSRHIIEGRMSQERRKVALEELAAARFVYYSDGWLWVRSRVKHMRTRGEKMAASVIKSVEKVPAHHPLRAAFLAEYLEGSWVSFWLAQQDLDTPSVGHRNPIEGLQGLGKGKGKGKVVTKDDELPAGFPADLTVAVDSTRPVLQSIADARSAKPVTRLALAKVIEQYPRHAHLKVARALDHWLLHGDGERKPCKDVVARYRNFLDREEPVATSAPTVTSSVTDRMEKELPDIPRRQIEMHIFRLERSQVAVTPESIRQRHEAVAA